MVVGLGMAMFAIAVCMVIFGLVLPKEVVRRSHQQLNEKETEQ